MSHRLSSCVLACAVLLAACDSTVEVADDAVACAGAPCTAGACFSNGGQPACRCGAWEEAAKVTCAVAAFEEPDDHGGSPGEATVLTLPMARSTGSIERGRRDDMRDRDLFAFTSAARHAYAFRCGQGTLPDCKLRLLDSSGKGVSFLLQAEGRISVVLALLDAGTWYVEVAGGAEVGTYTYELLDLGPDDHGDTREQATVLQSSSGPFPVRHSLSSDRDVFTFRVVPDHGYRFSCEHVGALFQELRLTTAGGTLVDSLESPDTHRAGVGGRAQMASDWYVELRATASLGSSTSSCRLEDLGADEHSDVQVGATPVTPGVAVPVTLQWTGDVDMLSFTGEPGHLYTVRTEPSGPWDLKVLDASGVVLRDATTDTVSFTPSVPGTYFLQVQGGLPWQPRFLLAVMDLRLDDEM
ncbi:PPC domain-containing protein [Pyxidicoccus trucidator]|uniref:PPC domain-containing protein n=1 Tax=Pyxidicoccus trucidator TaxID=2709662 RepID=UPI0013DD3121|nr:PPC domain-containing protein [Pyxidicoccus trucidator]